jgi:MSHA biogenesis protein MshN
MDLIKTILGRFNKRGGNTPPVKPAAGSKRVPINPIKLALIGGGVLLVLSAAGWFWWSSRPKNTLPPVVAQAPAKPISAPQAIPQPVIVPVVASEVEVSQPVATSSPVVVATQEEAPKPAKEEKITDNKPKSAKEHAPSAVHETEPKEEAKAASPSSELEVAPAPEKPAKTVKAPKPKHPKPVPTTHHEEKSAPEDEPVVATESGLNKQVKPLSLQQQAENEFRRANGYLQQGRADDAQAGYEAALKLDAGHVAARKTLVALLLNNKHNADAELVLQEGLKHNLKDGDLAMLLARIQVEREAFWSALLVLQKTMPFAERRADYRAFVAALLQRLNRHKEAVTHYQAAVQLAPNSGVWWMGLGISLRALQRNEEARAAFRHALETNTLSADLQTFVTQQLKEL